MDDDIISRQAAIELWEEYHPYIAVKACEYGKRLRSLPSAERHGRWMQEEYIDGEWYHTCSSCGMSLKKDAFDNFCGNCGAKMDEVEQNG